MVNTRSPRKLRSVPVLNHALIYPHTRCNDLSCRILCFNLRTAPLVTALRNMQAWPVWVLAHRH